jgi:hypothetical protein
LAITPRSGSASKGLVAMNLSKEETFFVEETALTDFTLARMLDIPLRSAMSVSDEVEYFLGQGSVRFCTWAFWVLP